MHLESFFKFNSEAEFYVGLIWAINRPWPKMKTPQSLERGVFVGGERGT